MNDIVITAVKYQGGILIQEYVNGTALERGTWMSYKEAKHLCNALTQVLNEENGMVGSMDYKPGLISSNGRIKF